MNTWKHSAGAVRTLLWLAFAVILGWGSKAAAVVDLCLKPATAAILGPPGINGCTANDFGVANITSVTILDDGCTGPSDTVTFSGVMDVSPRNPASFDIGFYIATDGLDALNGASCDVYTIPPNSFTDGDACGDYQGGGVSLAIPVSSVTVACADGDLDGYLDIHVCSSYAQSADPADCPDYHYAVPGTSSKCNCGREVPVPLIPVPTCAPGPCCSSGSYVAGGTTCRAATGMCDAAETCTGTTSTCPTDTFAPSSTVCRNTTGVCDITETCTGTSGSCPADAFQSSATTCRGASGVCDVAEACTGSTASCPPDTCLSGSCSQNLICENCSVALRKTYTGDPTPGGEITYTLQWSNSCVNNMTNVTITDAVPATLEVLSATSAAATATVAGNLVTFFMPVFPGGSVVQAMIVTRIRPDTPLGTTIENFATVAADGGYTDSVSSRLRVRDAAAACPVSLKKVHSGNNSPGGEIQYSLQWSNACANDLTGVTVTDPLPAGLTLLSATSLDATVSVSGNTATFVVPVFRAGSIGQGFLTARIDTDTAGGTGMRNVATLEDSAGNSAEAVNFFRVRGESTDADDTEGGLSCFLRGNSYARPGRYVKYEVRYKNGSSKNELTLRLPDEVDIDSVYPAPTSIDGQTLYWSTLAATSGKAKVNTLVSRLAQDQTVLTASALMDDRGNESAVCEHNGVVSRYEKLFASIKGPTYGRAGQSLRYIARYREVVGLSQMTVSLPDEVSVVRAIPAPTGGSGKTLTWRNLPIPAGVVKIDTVVAGVPTGTVLSASMQMADETTDIVSSENHTTIGLSSDATTGGATGSIALSLSALRSVTAGTNTDISARYDGIQAPGGVAIELPPEMTPVLSVPSAEVSGRTVIWSGIESASGSVKVRVAVAATAAAGKTLPISASATDGSAASATAAASTVVRSDSPTSGPATLSAALTLARSVTKGLTTDIDLAYDGLSGIGQATLALPPGMTVQSTVPSGAAIAAGSVVWSGLSDSSGSLRARVVVPSSAASGSTLAVNSVVTASDGSVASAAATTEVR